MRGSKSLNKKAAILCFAAAMAVGAGGCGGKSPLDPKDPVSLTVWHYYNGSQQAGFHRGKGRSRGHAGYFFVLCGYCL